MLILFESQDWYQPKIPRLDVSSKHCASIVLDVVQKSQFFCRILMPFVSGINMQEEYCLSLARILTSRYQSVVDDRMKIKRTSNVVNMLEESTLNYHIVLQWRINEGSMKDQWDYVLNDLEELGDKQLFLKYQCSSDISFLVLLLLPSIISNDRLTNVILVEIDFDDNSWSCRIELLRRFLVVLFESVEEDWLLSSKSRTQREKNLLVQYQSTFFHSSEWCSVNQQVLFFVVLLLSLIWLQHPSHSVCNACSSGRSAGTSVLLWFESITNLFDPWEILTQD